MIAPPRRGRRAAIVIAAAAAILGIAVVVAWWNPWNLANLSTFARWGTVAVLFLAPLAVGVIILLYVRVKAVAITLAVFCGLLALVLFICMGILTLINEPHSRRLLSISDNGRYHVSEVVVGDSLSEQRMVKVSRPDGLNTRESARPLLCVESNFKDGAPIRFDSVTFVGAHEVELVLTDDSRHRITFDPVTVEPAYTLSVWCQLHGPRVRTLK